MRVVIIEDEILLANDLSQTLQQISSSFEIVDILTSVHDSIQYFSQNTRCDLIFSDIELEDGLCFEIFKVCKITVPVIFCTAYDEYALEAFKANGIEYILKPFTTEAIIKALEKVELLKNSLHNHLYKQFRAATDTLALYEKRASATLMVRFRNQLIPVQISAIAIIYIENEITYVFTKKQRSFVVSYTLDEMENKAGEDFFRVNRQFLINRSAILEAVQIINRRLKIVLDFSFHREIQVSKEKVTEFRRWLAK